jgi:hypothetical protein
MSGVRSFACPGCGKRFIWASRIAGTSFGCSCGKRFMAPIEPPAIPDAYDIASDASSKKSSRPVETGPRQLEYESKTNRSGVTIGDILKQLRDVNVIVPAIAAILGIGFRYSLPHFISNPAGAPRATLITLGLLINIVTMFCGIGIVARFTGAELGSLPAVISKLCAIAVIGSVLFAFVANIDKGDGIRGLVMALQSMFLFNWVCFATQFDLDIQESLFAVAVVGLLQAAGACMLWRA